MNLLDALSAAGIRWRQGAGKGEITICCPMCVTYGESPDVRFRCGINVYSNLGHCYNCGWKTRNAYFHLKDLLGLGEVASGFISLGETRERPSPVELPEGYETLYDVNDCDDPLFFAKQYLLKRGIPEWQMEEKQIGAAIAGEYARRIIFPVWFGRLLCGYCTRDYSGTAFLRYKNSTGTKSVYNLPTDTPAGAVRACKPPSLSMLVLSEGCFKALAIERALGGQRDIHSGASLGNQVNPSAVIQIMDYKHILLWPDPGSQGIIGYLKAAQTLQTLTKIWFPAKPFEKQADEMMEDEILAGFVGLQRYTPALEIEWRGLV